MKKITSSNPNFLLSSPILPSPPALNSNLPGGRGEIDDGTSGESVPSSISSDFPKAAHIREAFWNIRERPREKGAG